MNALQALLDSELLAEAYSRDFGPTKLEEPIWDARRCLWVCGSTMTHVVEIMPLLWGYHQIALTPYIEFGRDGKDVPFGLDKAWQYPDFNSAAEAALRWNFLVDDEPTGYTKRVV